MQQPQTRVKAGINLKLHDLEDVKCQKCGNIFFDGKTRVKKVSPLYTEDGKPMYIPVEIVFCRDCGEIIEELDLLKVII